MPFYFAVPISQAVCWYVLIKVFATYPADQIAQATSSSSLHDFAPTLHSFVDESLFLKSSQMNGNIEWYKAPGKPEWHNSAALFKATRYAWDQNENTDDVRRQNSSLLLRESVTIWNDLGRS